MESMGLKLGLLLTSLTVSAVLVLGTAGNLLAEVKSVEAERASLLAEKEPVGYVLKIYQGKVALFRENSDKPYQISEIEAYLLPDADRQVLEKGISADNEEELKAILEDWDG